MIQSAMLAAMGFVAASLLALLIAPAFWARAVRLTTRRLREVLPLSEQEVRADKDLLRAEFALKVHQLEREVELGRLAAHRRQIEINRRDIDVRRLTESLATSQSDLTENTNARSVLEQTVTERIPLLEASLAQARDILKARDTAIEELQATAESQTATIEEGRAILTQRALEVQRLQALFQEASAQGRDMRADGGSDSLLLRAEIESLKSRLAERTAVIDRLQSEVSARPRTAGFAAGPMNAGLLPEDATPVQLRSLVAEQTNEIARLRRDLSARASGIDPTADANDSKTLTARHLVNLEEQLRNQTSEIARLKADSEAIAQADDPTANARIRESKVWLRSRVQRFEDDLERERNTAGRLRAELAAANERIARQSAQFRDELRKQASRTAIPARDLLRDGARTRGSAGERNGQSHGVEGVTSGRTAVSSRARELQRALQGQFANGTVAAPEAPLAASELPAAPAGEAPIPIIPANSDATPAAGTTSDGTGRGRLLDRLKSYEQA
jgi:chromosome segregation ATPase